MLQHWDHLKKREVSNDALDRSSGATTAADAPSTSRSPSPQQARDEASQARARRLRDLAAWLLRRDGALSSNYYDFRKARGGEEALDLVESVLDHLRDDELGDIQEDSSQRGRRSRRKKPTADALERLVAALPARDLAALADVELPRRHVGPGGGRRVASQMPCPLGPARAGRFWCLCS